MSAAPRLLSPTPSDTDVSSYHLGLEALGLGPTPQGEQYVRIIEAKGDDGLPLYRFVVCQMPRRATKTTAMWACLIGRCLANPKYRVLYFAQDGTRGSMAIQELFFMLDEEDERWTFYRKGGQEEVRFSNGSRILTRKPDADKARGTFADVIVFDEAGVWDAAESQELERILPLLDSKRAAQVLVTGTPMHRNGMLWEYLQDAYAGKPRYGGIDYSARDDDDPNDPDVWERVHPGIGTITDLDTIRDRYDRMDLATFCAEYLGLFPLTASNKAVDYLKWLEGREEMPDLPENFAVSYDIHPDGEAATFAAAWRDDDGTPHVGLLERTHGTKGLGATVKAFMLKYPNANLWYDQVGTENHELAQDLRLNNRIAPRVKVIANKDVPAGQAAFVRLANDGKVMHPDQVALNQAVEGARWRVALDKGRYLAWKQSDNDISPIRACAQALWAYDHQPKAPEKRTPVFVTGR